MPNKIVTKKFERDFAKKSCFEYCYIDPAFCPLCNIKQGNDQIVGTDITIQRWTDIVEGTNYNIKSSSQKKQPYQQGTDGAEPDNSSIEEFTEKLAFENAHTPFSCWGDGSGFEYDTIPENVIGPAATQEDVYDITNFGIIHQPLKLSEWNAWSEKFQKDYRFAQVSDLNATTNLFPNVDDPWMFTEYVFKGVEEGEIVVEPPLFYEKSLKIKNTDTTFTEQELVEKDLEEKYDSFHLLKEVITTEVPPEVEGGETEYNYENFYHAKQFRQIVNWDVFNRDETKRNGGEFRVNDAGVKLYKVEIPVESIKWGEHGNIPPHTINMSAPANWFEARQVGKIKPKYIAHIGTPFYASSYGVLYWDNKEAYVEYVDPTTLMRTDDYYSYTTKEAGPNGIKQNMPSTLRNSNGVLRNTVQKVSDNKVNQDFIHGGCVFMEGKSGQCRCKALDEAIGAEKDYLSEQFDNFAQCSTYNYATPTCTKRIQDNEYPILAIYEGTASDKSEYLEQMHGVYSGEGADQRAWSDSVLSGSVGLPSADMFAAMSMYTSPKRGRPDLATETSVSVWYETSFEYVYEDANSIEMEVGGIGAFKKGAIVKRGTGKTAITTSDNSSPFKSGEPDNFAFGDLDQLSFHRWFNNVMHCQNCTYCNDVYGSLKMVDGFDPNIRAGGDGACRYYSNKHNGKDCPTDRVPKRAYEFQMMANTAFSYFNSMGQWWSGFNEEQRLDYNSKFIYERVFDKYEEGVAKYKNTPTSQFFLMPVYIGDDSDLTKIGATSVDILNSLENPEGKTEFNNVGYIIYSRNNVSSSLAGAKTYDNQTIIAPNALIDYITSLPDYDASENLLDITMNGNTLIGAFYKIGMMSFSGDCFLWYDHLTDSGKSVETWFLHADPTFMPASYNSVIVDNEEKFIGGFHPQYKDYSEIGEEFMMDIPSDTPRDAAGDIIGDYDNDGIAQPVNKKGYWVDFSGKYIVEEKDMKLDEPLAGDDDREQALKDPALTVSFKKSNTSMSAEDGEMKSPETVNCAVLLNDSHHLLYKYKYNKGETPPVYDNGLTGGRKGWSYPDARPQYEDNNGNTYWAPPYVADFYAIPTMRMVAHCTHCGYYLVYKYHDLLCPWCGERLVTVPGNKGTDIEDGDCWTDFFIERSEITDPENIIEDGLGGGTYDGKKVVDYIPVMKKLFKVKAIGTVQVWAPVGTSIKKDAYYWKNPTVVNNSIKTQMKQRLGSNVDGTWKFDKMSQGSEFTLGLPDQIGNFKPMPAFESAEIDGDKFYSDVTWEGVTKEDRRTYASYNDIMPNVMMPMLGVGNPTHENLILPYTNSTNDGLKMITINEIRNLRNHLQPMLGYISETVTQNDFDTLRADFNNREDVSYPRFYHKKKCLAQPVVQAIAENRGDSYVQFWSGDRDYGSVREYYPAGHSWWKLNNVIGGKYDDQTGGYYHFSGNSPYGGGKWVHSKAAIFIHGMLPLDKEILKAYLVFYPAGEPYKEPIGRGWNGTIHYEHYHPFTEEHHGDGAGRHLHGQAGFLGNFDEEGNYTQADGGKIRLMDESDYYGWGGDGDKFKTLEEYTPFIDDKFGSVVTGLCGVYDDEFWKQYGTSVTSVANTGLRYYNISPNTKENIKFKLVQLDGNGDLKIMYSFSEIWRSKTVGEMRNLVDQHLVEATIRVGDGTIENTIENSIVQWSSKMLNDIIPENTQNIPGYFNYSGINSAKVYGNSFKIGSNKPEYFDGPIIVQNEKMKTYLKDGGEFGGGGATGNWGDEEPDSYSGSVSQTENSGGIKPRIIDATDVVKKLYNKRIPRTFVCNGGKSMSELLAQEYPTVLLDEGFYPENIEWNGVGSPTQIKINEAALWNQQIKSTGFSGYLLNDNYTYPILEDDLSLRSNDTGGDKYETAPSKIEFSIISLIPFQINETNNKYHIDAGEYVDENFGSVKTLTHSGLVIDIEKVIELLTEVLGSNFTITKISKIKCKIVQNDGSTIKELNIKDTINNCYGIFGLSIGSIVAVQDRCIGVSSFVDGHKPAMMNTDGDWQFNVYNDSQQYFILDLVRSPLEYSESNYRHKPPSIDCTSCLCPSSGCSSGGVPIGAYMKSLGETMLANETSCPICGTDLSTQPGAINKSGDGLYTYAYDDNFYIDAFVTGIKVKPKAKCNYRVSIRGNTENYWMPLVNVVYDIQNEEYINYPCYGNGSVSTNSEPFEDFVLPENKYRRARYVLVECDGNRQSIAENYVVDEDVTDTNRYKIVISGNFTNMGIFDFSGLIVSKLRLINGGSNTEEAEIITTELNEALDKMTIYFNVPIYNVKNDVITLNVFKWTGGIEVCKIYGTHYKESELKITDREETRQFFINSENLEFQLSEYPTQIMGVSCGKNGMGGIELTEVDDENNLQWTTEEKSVFTTDGNEYKILRITSGVYFFDYKRNKIKIPTKDQNNIEFGDFEENLIGTKYSGSLLPSIITIRYWSGNGYEIDLKADAMGEGPSYQLEKETITKIENISLFPDNGNSVKMQAYGDNSASRKSIPWYCYNKEATTLPEVRQMLTKGYWGSPQIPYNALNNDNDKTFVDLFGEENRLLNGRVETTITFVGGPNQIITGTILVTAPDLTTRTLKLGDSTITTYERTGGIENGCIITSIIIDPCEGRKTLAWNVPTLIIYAKERNPSDSITK